VIARLWRGRATPAKADDYLDHFTSEVVPNLSGIAGHKGAYLLRRETDGQVEFVAVTLWDSLETIKKFSGDDPEVAHIEPRGRAALAEFDAFARNYEIVCEAVDRDR
jgi:heme-degrading monooxygenase HmoA